MTDTIKTMEHYVFADHLTPDQLMEGDMIKIHDEFGEEMVTIRNIHAIDEGYLIEAFNDFDEEIDIPALDDTRFEWYVIVDE